jgi:hypothetical protein
MGVNAPVRAANSLLADCLACVRAFTAEIIRFGRNAVPHYQPPGAGLRHILFLALLGLGVVFLSGPVIALASIILSVVLTIGVLLLVFAAIGFVVWAPAYYFYAGREAAGERIGAMRRSIGATLRRLAHVGARAVILPARFVARLFRGGLYTAKVTGHFIGEVVVVGLTGAAIGAALGLTLSAMNNQNPVELVPINAAVGGGIASVVGVVLAFFPRRSAQQRRATV